MWNGSHIVNGKEETTNIVNIALSEVSRLSRVYQREIFSRYLVYVSFLEPKIFKNNYDSAAIT